MNQTVFTFSIVSCIFVQLLNVFFRMTDLTDQEFKNLTFFEKEMKSLFLEKRLIKPQKSFSAVFHIFWMFSRV